MLTSETKRRIDSCRDILVGKLPLPTDQVELITLALIYKFMDDLDEESVAMGGKRSFFTGALAPYRWRELMRQTVSADERMARFADGLELLGGAKKLRDEQKQSDVDVAAHLPPLFRDIFRNAFLKFRDGRILTLFLTELGGFAYSHSEELGNAFEYILQCMGAQGDNGQFRTPRHIIDFIVACLDPQPGERILDPACGTGGFLVSAFRHILAHHTSPGSTLRGDRLTHEQRRQLYGNFTGYDINDQMVKLSRVNLFLHDFATPTIHIYDTLTNDARWHEKYDLILANPPFMTPKGGVVPHTRFRIPAKKSEVLFTDYIAEHLTPDGRAGVIVPNGIVATTQNAYVKLRRFLVEDSLVAVVSLPAGCFKPYSGVKTSILFLDKKLARSTDRVLFLKIAADGFDLGDKRNEIEANDLPEAERLVKAWFKGILVADFATPVEWRLAEKRELLAHSSVSLSAERFFGEADIVDAVHARVPLGDLLSFVGSGFTPKGGKANYPSSGVRFIRSQNVLRGSCDFSDAAFISEETHAEMIRTAVKQWDVFLNITGASIGRSAVYKETQKANVNQHVAILRPTDKLLPVFLSHCLNGDAMQGQIQAAQSGASREGLNYQQIKELEIPLPPLDEQRRIVAEIEGYQQVIDGARQILAAYRHRVAVDPDWPVVELGDIVDELESGVSVNSTSRPIVDGEVGILKTSCVTSGAFEPQQHKAVLPDETKRVRCPVRRNTIIISRMNTEALVGANAYVGADYPRLFLPDRLWQTVISRRDVVVRYVQAVLASDICRARISALSHGTSGSMKNISKPQLLSLEVPLPPLPEQERIVAELETEAAKIEVVRGLIPAFEAKIQRVLARVWGTEPA